MDRLSIEELDRPLYIGSGRNTHGLELHFGSDGDFFVMKQVVEAIRDELDSLGFPVVAIPWSNQPYEDRDVLCFSFDTEGLTVPEELLNEIRLAVKVRCWGVGSGHVEEYYFDGKHLNTEVHIVLLDGRASPNHSELERNGVKVDRKENRFSFLVNDKEIPPQIDTVVVAEALGIYLQGGVSETTQTQLCEVAPDPVDDSNTLEAPDSVSALERLWQLSTPPETD